MITRSDVIFLFWVIDWVKIESLKGFFFDILSANCGPKKFADHTLPNSKFRRAVKEKVVGRIDHNVIYRAHWGGTLSRYEMVKQSLVWNSFVDKSDKYSEPKWQRKLSLWHLFLSFRQLFLHLFLWKRQFHRFGCIKSDTLISISTTPMMVIAPKMTCDTAREDVTVLISGRLCCWCQKADSSTKTQLLE